MVLHDQVEESLALETERDLREETLIKKARPRSSESSESDWKQHVVELEETLEFERRLFRKTTAALQEQLEDTLAQEREQHLKDEEESLRLAKPSKVEFHLKHQISDLEETLEIERQEFRRATITLNKKWESILALEREHHREDMENALKELERAKDMAGQASERTNVLEAEIQQQREEVVAYVELEREKLRLAEQSLQDMLNDTLALEREQHRVNLESLQHQLDEAQAAVAQAGSYKSEIRALREENQKLCRRLTMSQEHDDLSLQTDEERADVTEQEYVHWCVRNAELVQECLMLREQLAKASIGDERRAQELKELHRRLEEQSLLAQEEIQQRSQEAAAYVELEREKIRLAKENLQEKLNDTLASEREQHRVNLESLQHRLDEAQVAVAQAGSYKSEIRALREETQKLCRRLSMSQELNDLSCQTDKARVDVLEQECEHWRVRNAELVQECSMLREQLAKASIGDARRAQELEELHRRLEEQSRLAQEEILTLALEREQHRVNLKSLQHQLDEAQVAVAQAGSYRSEIQALQNDNQKLCRRLFLSEKLDDHSCQTDEERADAMVQECEHWQLAKASNADERRAQELEELHRRLQEQSRLAQETIAMTDREWAKLVDNVQSSAQLQFEKLTLMATDPESTQYETLSRASTTYNEDVAALRKLHDTQYIEIKRSYTVSLEELQGPGGSTARETKIKCSECARLRKELEDMAHMKQEDELEIRDLHKAFNRVCQDLKVARAQNTGSTPWLLCGVGSYF